MRKANRKLHSIFALQPITTALTFGMTSSKCTLGTYSEPIRKSTEIVSFAISNNEVFASGGSNGASSAAPAVALRQSIMVDSVYRTRSLGVATEGLPDQYADGKAAKVWEVYIGDKNSRTDHYKQFLSKLLTDHSCKHVLDVACGTGVDSILLLEQGFQVTSVDASDKMLKYALKERWNRRREPAFDNWVIEEANWLTLPDDIHCPGKGFDAVICLGNSFAHLPDFHGDQRNIKLALKNFHEMVKPGGILIIDHRNYDYILDTGKTPPKNIYYNSKNIKEIQTSILYQDGVPTIITLDYTMDISNLESQFDKTDSEHTKKGRYAGAPVDHFRLSYYPHRLDSFSKTLEEVFGPNFQHRIYGDFKRKEEIIDPPAFYIHAITRTN